MAKVTITITVESDEDEPTPRLAPPTCRAHRVLGCVDCAKSQCTYGWPRCILPTGHKPEGINFEHNLGGLSPESVWLPAHMA